MGIEKIVCSAIKIEGVNDEYDHIYVGLRHCDCFGEIARVRKLLEDSDEKRIACLRNNIQGFLTSKNRFVDRKEAYTIAIENNQIINESPSKSDELFSENLY
ncbi:hypothetical protein HOA59_00690 [archaeon]|jgi:hypothetical protein|nr:hypothetical protein [archaeon]MBT6823937.1 hypothetical protein [archaeon]MBT7107167.1 hypothetical protein [archaeon]MBT7297763.1 hypothetical protein [archaeon]